MQGSRKDLAPVATDAPTVWASADFIDRASWTFELSPPEQRVITDYGQNPSDLDLRGALEDVASRWLDVLVAGPGFLLLRGFPVHELTPEQTEVAYLALGRLVGTLVGQDRKGSLTTHIRDERLPAGPGVRKYQTNQSQNFHSDASDIVGLLCLHPAKSGGSSRIISTHAVYNEMLQHDPYLTGLLFEPFPWSRHTEQRPGESPYFELAPIAFVRGTPRVSIIPWFIRQSQAHPTAPRLSSEQLAALDLMEYVMSSPELQVVMDFGPGDVQFLNNTTVLHARDAYEDYDDPALRRHLIRLWLTMESPVAEDILSGQTDIGCAYATTCATGASRFLGRRPPHHDRL